jgi:hypothetical protein
LPKLLDLIRTQSFGATGYDPPTAHHERLDDARVAARRGNVVEGAQEPQADRDIRHRVMADLLKCRIEKALGPDPWNDHPDDVWWIAKQ